MFSFLKKSQIQDLSRIIDLQQAVATSTMPLESLMDLICVQTQELTNASGAVVEMFENEDMVYKACSGSLAGMSGLRLKAGSSLSGLSVKKAEVLYCYDSEIDERVDKEASRKVGARSMICVPLITAGKAIGVLKVVSPVVQKFSDRDVGVLRLIAGLLSATLFQAKEKEEKEKISEALRQSDAKSREASRMKSEFLANMSHEIRTPLNGVMGVADLLLDTELKVEQRQYAEIIKASADVLLNIVNDILDFSKIEANKLLIENIEFNLFECLDNIKKVFLISAQKKGLNFIFDLPKEMPQWVRGDPTRLQQILTNLINNAIKFTQAGFVKVEISWTQQEKVTFHFKVTDSGIGMPPKVLSEMFRPFSQGDASTTRKFGGTGLGLSICHRLAELMMGQIGVESFEGVGSTFSLSIPFDPVQAAPAGKKTIQSDSKGKDGLRVLVAEDNLTNQIVIKAMLTKLGHQTTLVENGEKVLMELNKNEYDVVLMDCQMPIMDGYEVSRRIRSLQKESWHTIPIAAMTASALAGDRTKCLEAGMTDYVTKPLSLEDLQSLLGRMRSSKWVKIE